MRGIARKLAALVLLLVMPLQGAAAASLSVVQCQPAEAGASYSPAGDDRAAQQRDEDTVKKFFEHFFCHQLLPGIPVFPATIATIDLPVLVSSIFPLSSLFLPDQPERPPFAASA